MKRRSFAKRLAAIFGIGVIAATPKGSELQRCTEYEPSEVRIFLNGEEIDGMWVEDEVIMLRKTGEIVARRVSTEPLVRITV